MDTFLILRDIVGILLMSPMPTLIMWLPWCLLVLVFTEQWPELLIQIVSNWEFGLKLVSDGNLEILLDNGDDANTSKLIKYIVTQF